MSGYQVPADLAGKDWLTQTTIRAVLRNRARRKVLQNRINAVPAKIEAWRKEIAELNANEVKLLHRAGDEH